MSRPRIYKNARRVNIVIEADDHKFGKEVVRLMKYRGGFSEYVTRLLHAERVKAKKKEARS